MKKRVCMACLVLSICYAKNISNSVYYGIGIGNGFNNSNLISNQLVDGSIPATVNANAALFNTYSVLVKDRSSAQLLGTVGYLFETSSGYKASLQVDAAFDTIEDALYQPTPTNVVDIQSAYDYGASLRFFRNSNAVLDPFFIAGLRSTVLNTTFSNYSSSVRTDSYYRKTISAPEIGVGLHYARNEMVDMRLEYKYFFGGKTQGIVSTWTLDVVNTYIEDKVLIKQHSLQFFIVY